MSLNRKYRTDVLEELACVRVRLEEEENAEDASALTDGPQPKPMKDGEPGSDGAPRPVCFITLTNSNLRPDGTIVGGGRFETAPCLPIEASFREKPRRAGVLR